MTAPITARRPTCVYCGYWGGSHKTWCPQVTNLFPVLRSDAAAGVCCCDCRQPLQVGDRYTVTNNLILCVSCAALALTKETP